MQLVDVARQGAATEFNCFAQRQPDTKMSITGEVLMPELSRFHGLIIRMFMEQGERHHLPHFHVYYQEYVATYSIDPIEPLHGALPTRQRRLLEGWAELHQEELLYNWQQLQAQLPTSKIVPLR